MAFPEFFYAVMESSFQEHITATALLYEQQPIGRWQHIISTHGAILGIFLAGLLLLAIPRTRRAVAWLLVSVQSLVGTVLLVFWLVGGYPQAAMNINLAAVCSLGTGSGEVACNGTLVVAGLSVLGRVGHVAGCLVFNALSGVACVGRLAVGPADAFKHL